MRRAIAWLVGSIALPACGRVGFTPVDDDATVAPRCEFRTVMVGSNRTCAIDQSGTVWCWGRDVLVPGPPHLAAEPVALPRPALDLSGGSYFDCARLDDETVWCWGDVAGEATTSSPKQIALGDAAAELDVGPYRGCIRRRSDAAIECWGDNRHFTLGNTGPVLQPPSVIAGTVGSKRLAIGHGHSCAIDAQDRVVCWGRNDRGQLGDGTMMSRATPMPVTLPRAATDIITSARTSCATDDIGDVRCWGENANGQLGDGTRTVRTMPSSVAVSGTAAVYATKTETCALRIDAAVVCWGNGATRPGNPIVTQATELAMEWGHACAVTGDGLVCWGRNWDGELGRGTRTVSADPTPIALPAPADGVLGGGFGVACATAGGRLYCWGGNVGDGSGTASTTPVEPVLTLSPVDGVTCSLGAGEHCCAWGGGSAACWGGNQYGQLGDGTASLTPRASPVALGLTGVSAMTASGSGFTCAIASGQAHCWGRNESGQLGTGNMMASSTPVTVLNVTSPTSISAGVAHVCAVAGGQLYCWGNNSQGQLGDGTQTVRPTPVSPTLPAAVVEVSAGGSYTCARTTDGTVYCWGHNAQGQLGMSPPDRRLPNPVLLPMAAVRISAGMSTACAQLTSGQVYCWGTGEYGQLGNGEFAFATPPAEVPALAGATQMFHTNFGACAIVGGEVVCWGEPSIRGVDDNSNVPLPIAVTCSSP